MTDNIEELALENTRLKDKLARICALVWEEEAGFPMTLSAARVRLVNETICDGSGIVDIAGAKYMTNKLGRYGHHKPDLKAIKAAINAEINHGDVVDMVSGYDETVYASPDGDWKIVARFVVNIHQDGFEDVVFDSHAIIERDSFDCEEWSVVEDAENAPADVQRAWSELVK